MAMQILTRPRESIRPLFGNPSGGSIPWDFVPNSGMTNATVESTVANIDGQVLVVKYKDNEQKIAVPQSAEMLRTFLSAELYRQTP